MLKYSVNINDLSLCLNELKYSHITYSGGNINFKNVKQKVLNDDVIKFLRSKGNKLYFSETIEYDIDADTLITPKLEDYEIYPSEVIKKDNITLYPSGTSYNALFFYFNSENMHDFIDENKYGNITIKEYGKRVCEGDYVLYDDTFLLKVKDFNENSSIIFEDDIYNVKHDIYFLRGDDKVTLSNCIVPVKIDGEDNRFILIWLFDGSNNSEKELSEFIIDNFYKLTFKTIDDRFYTIIEEINEKNEKKYIFSFRDTSGIFLEEGHTNISLPINEQFELNMHQSENINSHTEKIIEESINDIIDMEKQIFEPVLIHTDSADTTTITCENIDSINFNLKFRLRYNSDSGSTEDIINAWDSDNISYNWVDNSKNADLLGYLGYTDDDIYYRKKNLKKSFIRLMFYDTNNPKTQSLLYYSTIFFNTGKIYGNYCKNITNGGKGNLSLTDNEPNLIRLDASFSIKNCHDRFNSSEGFYLYLFPNLCKGTSETTIYMKVEFNHAKFGKRIPMVILKDEIKDCYISDEINYTEGINNLFNDLYIPIGIKYDEINNRYIWYVKGDNVDVGDNTMTFTYYEPVVNKNKTNEEV